MALSHEYKTKEALACLKKTIRLAFVKTTFLTNLLMLVLLILYIYFIRLEIKNKSHLQEIFDSAQPTEIREYLRNHFIIAFVQHLIVTIFDLRFANVYGSSLSDSLNMHVFMDYSVFRSASLGSLLKEQFEKGESASSFLYTLVFDLFTKFCRVSILIYELGQKSTSSLFKYGLIAGSVVHFLIYSLYFKTSNWHENRYLKSKIKVSSVVANEIINFDVVKCFNLEEKSVARLNAAAERQRNEKMRLERVNTTVRYLYRILEISSIGFFYFFYFLEYIDSDYLSSMQKQLVDLYESLRGILKHITEVNKHFFTFYTLETNLKKNQIVGYNENKQLHNNLGENMGCFDIKVENLTVETLFSNLSFEIHKNEKVAVVGANNSGKTTFMRTLVGLSDYQGRISINGIELDEISRKDLCSQISYVSQNIGYIQGTVMENLRYGNSLTEDEVVEKCKEFQVHEIFEGLEGGYNKISATVGTDLSGGQRQRVNVMRGILKNAPVLMVDECFSGISTHDKNLIIGKLLSLDDRTLIVATNDMDLLHKFDKILLLNGEKSAFGTFSDLKNVLVEQ